MKSRNPQSEIRNHPFFIRTRFGGRPVARANEDAAAAAAAEEVKLSGDFRVLDASGREIGMANAQAGADGQPFALVRANAVTALGAAVHPLLTNYANGYPADNVDGVVEFFAPRVPVPVIFQYRNPDLQTESGLEANDQIGSSGEPSMVFPNAESLTEGRLMFRGLETPFTAQDQKIAAAIPGNSTERERQRRVRFLIGTVRRGRAYRAYAAVQAAASSATGVTIATNEDPFKKIRSYLQTVILEAGSPEYVRICMGYASLAGFVDHPLVNGVTAGVRTEVSLSRIAMGLGIPEKNIMVSWHQVVSTAQGKSATKSVLIGSTQFYAYVCKPTPDEEDNSWLKTFSLAGENNSLDPFSVYNYTMPGLNNERIGLAYWETLKKTNTSANAFKRLELTFS